MGSDGPTLFDFRYAGEPDVARFVDRDTGETCATPGMALNFATETLALGDRKWNGDRGWRASNAACVAVRRHFGANHHAALLIHFGPAGRGDVLLRVYRLRHQEHGDPCTESRQTAIHDYLLS